MTGLLLVGILIALVIVFFVRKGRAATVTSLRASNGVPPDVALQARQEALVALIKDDNRDKYDNPPFTPNNERLVFSVPVVLSENHTTGRRGAGTSVRIMRGVWYHSGGSQSTQEISATDTGTLVLTEKRFIFGGARKNLEFPLDKLTQLSTSDTGIALGKSGREKVAYFTGLQALTLQVQVRPKADDTWAGGTVEFPLSGPDVLEIVRMLKSSHS